MPFKFDPAPEVLWPVTIETPADGGASVTHRIKVRYRLLKEAEVENLMQAGDDAELLRAVVTGWEEVTDRDGNPVPFSAEALAEALAWAFVRRAIVEGFFRANAGAPVKN